MKHLYSKIFLLLFFGLFFGVIASAADSGVVKINSKKSAMETVEKLKKLIMQQDFTIYSVHDHGDKKALKQVISFGNENHNGRIMWHDPAAGLELPLKIAIFQDDVGDTQVIYRKPTSLRNSYDVQDCRLLDELDQVMADLAKTAIQ